MPRESLIGDLALALFVLVVVAAAVWALARRRVDELGPSADGDAP